MISMTIPFLKDVKNTDETAVKSALAKTQTHEIAHANWKEQYPYKPNVKFKIAHNGRYLFLHYFVEEKEILAKNDKDNGDVWTDSCVEFFLSFDGAKYYNMEFNCIGKGLLGYRTSKEDAEHAEANILDKIIRYPSLGTKTIEKTIGKHEWDLLLVIPVESFWKEDLKSFSKIDARANFYKCGDNLTEAHFSSWSLVGSEQPNFHLPKYFGNLSFE